MTRFGRPVCKTQITRRAFMAWLAIFALFVQALAPLSAAQAFDATADGEFLVICTMSGVKTVAVGQDDQPIDPGTVISCPFCVVHAAGVVLPPQPLAFSAYEAPTKPVFVLPRADTHASLWRTQPRPPRGPPRTA